MNVALPASAALCLFALGVCQAQSDPFEPDDAQAFLGASMDGGQPDFIEDVGSFDPVEGWRILGRQLDGSGDLDWQVFFRDQFQTCPVEVEVRVLAEDNFARNNLRVEILAFRRDLILNPSQAPTVLQSCAGAPVGDTAITFETSIFRDEFPTYYRVRSCSNSGSLNYRFEYRITSEVNCILSISVVGRVQDVRNGRVVPGAYVYSDENEITFSAPDSGVFELLTLQDDAVILDFFADGLESLGPVNIGPVSQGEAVIDVTLLGQPPGLIFFSGFE
ncbi:MAG: hypothetical protein AAF358_01125 [Pseudomonadota bacterium]